MFVKEDCMNDFDMKGSFGGTSGNSPTPQRKRTRTAFTSIRAEQIPDIVCSAIILLGTLVTLFLWDTLSEKLFYTVLLPVIKVGGTIAIIVIIIAIIGLICAVAIDSRRHRWFF